MTQAGPRRRTSAHVGLRALRGTHRYTAGPRLAMRGRRTQGQPRWKSAAESSSCPAQLGPFVLGHAPCVLLEMCPYVPPPRVPGRLPDGLSGDGCRDVTAPHHVDLRVRQLGFLLRNSLGSRLGLAADPVGAGQGAGAVPRVWPRRAPRDRRGCDVGAAAAARTAVRTPAGWLTLALSSCRKGSLEGARGGRRRSRRHAHRAVHQSGQT